MRRVINAAMRAYLLVFFLISGLFQISIHPAYAEDAALKDLIREAMKKNPDILAAESRVTASGYRIPQAKSLPDPMLSVGYQNDGFSGYTYGDSIMSWWQYSASQTFPFPGKRSSRGDVAAAEAEVVKTTLEGLRLRVAARIRELYYDLFLVYKNIDIIKDKGALLARIEDAAVSRYSTGIASQQEVVMAQTEKYMLAEREAMFRQKMQSLEAMINQTVGRDIQAAVTRPLEPMPGKYDRNLNDLIKVAGDHSPEIKARQRMITTAEARVTSAKKDVYPDVTLSAGYVQRGSGNTDMWSLTTSVNLPVFYGSKQQPAINEAMAQLQEAKYDLESTKLMIASFIRDNLAMIASTERVADLYQNAIIPKASLDFDLAVSDYTKGKADVLTAVSRIKSLLDVELAYWTQLVEREKAISRIEGACGTLETGL
jgi:cobalt-zinc-cadmium efflux system outer membrane protein